MTVYRINLTGNQAKRHNGAIKLIHKLKISGIPYQLNNDGSIDIRLQSTATANRNDISFIDMKPFYAINSKHRSKNGGWYTKVPIQPGKNILSQLSPEDKSRLNVLGDGQTINLNDLDNLIGSFNDQITGETNDTNQPTPTMFRTVSNNSPANSWITKNLYANRDNPDIKNVTLDTNDFTPSDTNDNLSDLFDTQDENPGENRSIPQTDDFSNRYNNIPRR